MFPVKDVVFVSSVANLLFFILRPVCPCRDPLCVSNFGIKKITVFRPSLNLRASFKNNRPRLHRTIIRGPSGISIILASCSRTATPELMTRHYRPFKLHRNGMTSLPGLMSTCESRNDTNSSNMDTLWRTRLTLCCGGMQLFACKVPQ